MDARNAQWIFPTINTLTYRSLLSLTSFLPRKLAFQVARKVGNLRYSKKRLAIELHRDLESALGASPEQIEDWLKRSFELATCEDLESHLYSRVTRETISELIELRGIHHLALALDRGKGVILCSGHVRGHYTFFAALGLLGYKPNVIGHPPVYGPSPIERWFYQRRDTLMQRKLGCRFLLIEPDNFGVAVQAANALKRNEVVTIEIDKTSSRRTVEVRFLDGRVPFPSGPALLAQVTGAPLLNFFVYRPDQWTPQIAEIGPPLYVADDLVSSIQRCARFLEERILQHPAEWYHLWFPKWRLWNYLS